MKDIKQFLYSAFEKEVIALGMKYQKDKIEAYNEYIEKELNNNCLPYYDEECEEEIPFNLLGKASANLPDIFYQNDDEAINIRNIFKISEYNHERHGKIWACYVSYPKPAKTIKKINECFIAAEIHSTRSMRRLQISLAFGRKCKCK